MNGIIRTYSELMRIESYEERFEYLALNGTVARPTFGNERWMNQRFYHSKEWYDVRDYVIARDYGFDLGHRDFPIPGKIMIHHMNPLTPDQIEHADRNMLDPEFLISCSLATHNAIHYGDKDQLRIMNERFPNDMIPWR